VAICKGQYRYEPSGSSQNDRPYYMVELGLLSSLGVKGYRDGVMRSAEKIVSMLILISDLFLSADTTPLIA